MSNTNVLYLIGSLRNPRIPELAKAIREKHPALEVFDDWFAAGPEADDHWKQYEEGRGRSYTQALSGYAAKNVFAFDRRHLDRATHVLLVLPAGKSGHMEVMYAAYGAKLRPKVAILLDPEDVRWDVMYQFIPEVLNDDSEIDEWLSTGRGREEERVSDGGWSPGLLSERIGGSLPSLIPSYAATPSWGADALGQVEINGPSEQDNPTPCRCRKVRRQRASTLDYGSVESTCASSGGTRAGRGASTVESV